MTDRALIRWKPGMLRLDGYRYLGEGVWARFSVSHGVTSALHAPGQVPDLRDEATRCLLGRSDD